MGKSRLISSAVIALVGCTLVGYASPAFSAMTAPGTSAIASLQQNVTFMPRETRWLMVLNFNGAGGVSAQRNSFFAVTVENRPGFRRMQQQIQQTLGVNATKQIRSLWAFGAAQGPRSGAFILDTTVPAKTIIDKLGKNPATSRDSYDGVNIFRVQNSFGPPQHRHASKLFLAVVDPGIVVGSMNEKLLERSLDAHLGIKKSLSLKSHLFDGRKSGQMFYFSLVHLQRAIDAAQNPLNVPPQVRQIRAVHLMAVSGPKAVEMHGYLQMLSAKAANRSAAQLKLLKKMAYHANTGANATDHQMVLAGLIEHLKLSVKKDRVIIEWRMPYALLRHLAQRHR
ncbi:MAG: hypothetical protein ACP5O1_03140 [Phycisphaerae bacterium]